MPAFAAAVGTKAYRITSKTQYHLLNIHSIWVDRRVPAVAVSARLGAGLAKPGADRHRCRLTVAACKEREPG